MVIGKYRVFKTWRWRWHRWRHLPIAPGVHLSGFALLGIAVDWRSYS